MFSMWTVFRYLLNVQDPSFLDMIPHFKDSICLWWSLVPSEVLSQMPSMYPHSLVHLAIFTSLVLASRDTLDPDTDAQMKMKPRPRMNLPFLRVCLVVVVVVVWWWWWWWLIYRFSQMDPNNIRLCQCPCLMLILVRKSWVFRYSWISMQSTTQSSIILANIKMVRNICSQG